MCTSHGQRTSHSCSTKKSILIAAGCAVYKAGCEDGFNGRDGQLYGRPPAAQRGSSSREDVYADRPYSWTDMAFDSGYREGITLGPHDRGGNARSNFRNPTYTNADFRYRSA